MAHNVEGIAAVWDFLHFSRINYKSKIEKQWIKI
jgi:hypothetical protein